MKKTQSILTLSITFVLLGAVLLWAAAPQQTDHDDDAGHNHAAHAGHDHGEADHADHDGHDHDGESHESCPDAQNPHHTLCEVQLPAALAAIDKATKAVKYGDKKTALKELARLNDMVLAMQKSLAHTAQPAFINSRCPIMGKKIDPAKVTPALTRAYQGKKIAFCCAGCLPQWDKMTELQKTTKLKALTPVEAHHDLNDGGDHSGHVH